MPHFALSPLARRRVWVIAPESTGGRPCAAALGNAGATVTTTPAVPTAAQLLRDAAQVDVLLLVAPYSDPRDVVAVRGLRDAGFDGLILAVTGDASPAVANRWAALGGADDCLPIPVDPRELVGAISDRLVRSRNAAFGTLSAFAPGLDDSVVAAPDEAVVIA